MKTLAAVFCLLAISFSFVVPARAESVSCEELFADSLDSIVLAQRRQFVVNLQEVMDRQTQSKAPAKTQWLGILPSETKSVATKIDKVDEAMWKLTSHYEIEVGRIELFNAKGETLGLNLFSSGQHMQLSGGVIRAALIKALAQAWAQNDYFNITKVVVSHTHPGQGTLNFSKGDKELFVEMKQDMALLGLKDADLEAHLLAVAFFSEFKKKGIVIPASVHPVHDEISPSLAPETAVQNWGTIESLGKGYRDGKLTLKQLFFEMPEQLSQLFTSYYRP